MQVNGNAKELQLHAVVIKADGSIEELYKQLDDLLISLAANPPASK